MKVAIIGGHMTPALAVIKAKPDDWEVLYIGRKYTLEGDKAESLEYKAITQLGVPFAVLHPARLQRKLTRHTLPSLAKMPKSMMEAFRILKRYKPDVVLSFGGYVSVPVGFAAYILKIPIVIHEQTTEAGIANKIIARFAKKICISFSSSKQFFPNDKVILTGSPVLQTKPTKEFAKYKRLSNDLPLLVITGGSQGSHALNILIAECLQNLLNYFQIIHQTGDAKEYKDFDRLQKLRDSLPSDLQKRYLPIKFIHPDDITYVYEQADLVISRSGINTVLTLLLLNKPALLIPLPYGQKNEQLRNAKMLVSLGLGEIAVQDKLNSENLAEKIISMYKKKDKYKNSQLEEMKILHLNAAVKIIEVAKSVLQ